MGFPIEALQCHVSPRCEMPLLMRATIVRGVITFFPPIFPAKQKGICAEREKEACPARNGPSNAEQSTPVSRFPEQTFAPSLQSDANVP
jgi:hypothetical protein